MIDGQTIARDMDCPLGWEGFEASRHFSGEGVYQARFDWQGGPARLLLTQVCCCCTVELNGKEQGKLWMAPYSLPLKDLVPGENLLTVRVVNTWINHVIGPQGDFSLSQEPVTHQWPYFTGIIDDIRTRRLEPVRERQMIKEPQPSGLTGPVYLIG